MALFFKRFFAPILAISLVMLGGGYMLTFVSLRLSLEHYAPLQIGWVHSSYCLGMMVASLLAEKRIRKLGSVKAYTFSALLFVSTIILQGLIIGPISWSLLRMVAGFCIGVLYIVVESWLLIQSSFGEKGVVLSVYMIALYAAQAFAQGFQTLLNPLGYAPFLVAALFPLLSVLPIIWTKCAPPLLSGVSSKSVKEIFLISPVGCLGCVISGILLSSIYSFCPIFAEKHQVDVALFMGLNSGGGFCFQWPIGYLSDHMSRRKLLASLSLIALVPSLAMCWVTTKGAMYLFSFILGGIAYTIYPVATSYACESFQAEDITAVTGALLLAYSIGSVGGPLVSALFIESWGICALYFFIALITLAYFISIFLFRPQVPPPATS